MKVLFLLAALSFSAFITECPSKHGSAKLVEPQSNSLPTDTPADYLSRHWVNSSEEQKQDDKTQIYRPEGFKKFPPSRFRMQYVFHKNGDCEWYYLAPDDNHKFKSGKWRFDPKDENILEIIKDGTTESYKIIDLNKNVLRIAEVKPDIPGEAKINKDSKASEISIQVSVSSIIITNNSHREIYYTVFDSEVASRTEWVPLSSDRNRIFPKKSTTVSSENDFWPSGKAIVYWWNSGQKMDDVRSFTIDLR